MIFEDVHLSLKAIRNDSLPNLHVESPVIFLKLANKTKSLALFAPVCRELKLKDILITVHTKWHC